MWEQNESVKLPCKHPPRLLPFPAQRLPEPDRASRCLVTFNKCHERVQSSLKLLASAISHSGVPQLSYSSCEEQLPFVWSTEEIPDIYFPNL